MFSQLVPSLPPVVHASRRSRPTGLIPGTLVRTTEGEMPVEFLLAGDIVLTLSGPVELRGTSVLQARDFDVVILEPTAQVADGVRSRPLMVPADQQVLVRDWRATILHGQAQMLTTAASLVDDVLVRRESRAAQRLVPVSYTHLTLPTSDLV